MWDFGVVGDLRSHPGPVLGLESPAAPGGWLGGRAAGSVGQVSGGSHEGTARRPGLSSGPWAVPLLDSIILEYLK